MNVYRWWGLLAGYVDVEVRGRHPERFINMAVYNGMVLWDVRRTQNAFYLKMSIPSFLAIRPVAHATACRVHVTGRHGMPFRLQSLRRAGAMSWGVVAFVVLLYVLSSVVWSVQVTGTTSLDPAVIRAAAYANGLRPGTWKFGLDLPAINREILLAIPKLAWAAVEIRGGVAIVHVLERATVPPQLLSDYDQPADLVADEAAVIEEIITAMGTPMVKKGDVVSPGQVLIKGMVGQNLYDQWAKGWLGQVPAPVPVPVRATGIVRGRVWRVSTVYIPFVRRQSYLTGRIAREYLLNIRGHKFIIKATHGTGFERFVQEEHKLALAGGRNSDPPIELTIITYRELAVREEHISPEEAQAQAERLAQTMAAVSIGPDARIVKMDVRPGGQDRSGATYEISIETVESLGVLETHSSP